MIWVKLTLRATSRMLPQRESVYEGLLKPRGPKFKLLKFTSNAENFTRRLSWFISSYFCRNSLLKCVPQPKKWTSGKSALWWRGIRCSVSLHVADLLTGSSKMYLPGETSHARRSVADAYHVSRQRCVYIVPVVRSLRATQWYNCTRVQGLLIYVLAIRLVE